MTAIKTDGEGVDDVLVASLTSLCASYNKCLTALSRLRSGHMMLVHDYIIVPQKQLAASTAAAAGSIEKNAGGKGTGGTDLMHFLKPMRDNCNVAKVLKKKNDAGQKGQEEGQAVGDEGEGEGEAEGSAEDESS